MPIDKEGFFSAVNEDGTVEAGESGELDLVFENPDAPTDTPAEESEESSEDPFAEAIEPEEGESEEKESDEDPLQDEPREKKSVEKRIDKLVAERNTARDQIIELDKEVARLEGQVEVLQDQAAVIDKHYKGFKDPVGQMSFDADFMARFEELSKGNSAEAMAARQAAAAIMSQIDEGAPVAETPDTSTPAPQNNSTMNKLLQREAKRTIDDAMPEGVRAIFKNNLTDYIIGSVDADDLVSLSKDDVLDAARAFAKENGYTTDDIYTQKGRPSSSRKPATAGSRGQAETSSKSKAPESGSKDKPAPPKSLSEFNKNRESFLRELVGA